MNPKLQKIIGEIEKTKRKLADYQSRLRELERQKTEVENADIVALVRGMDILPGELQEIARQIMGRQNVALPDLDAPSSVTAQNAEKPTKGVPMVEN